MTKKEVEKRVITGLVAQKRALGMVADSLNSNFYKAVETISKRKGKIIVTGIGKSSFIGMKLSATLTSLGHSSVFLHPVEAMHGDVGVADDGDVVIALSFSGETVETIKIVSYLKKSFGIPILSVTGDVRSNLSRISDVPLIIKVTEEGSPHNLAPMASTTATLVLGDLLAIALTSLEPYKKSHFAKFHPGGSLGLSLVKVKDVMFKGKDIPLVNKRDNLSKILKQMSVKKRKGIVGVIDNSGNLKGIITDGDVRRFLMKNGIQSSLTAIELMTKNPKIISPEKSLKDALSIMENEKVTSLFVVDKEKRVVGFIHMHTILEEYVV